MVSSRFVQEGLAWHMMMDPVQKRSLTVLIVVIVLVIVGVYAVLVSGVLSLVFDPDVETGASTVSLVTTYAR